MHVKKILLVDDEMSFLETVTKRLSKRNLHIVQAINGQEALEKLGVDSCIEVVILDIKMPGMDGFETLAEIKRKHPLTEVIILTGHTTVESAIKGMRLGAFDYLMKPCDIEKLISKVTEALARRKSRKNGVNISSEKDTIG